MKMNLHFIIVVGIVLALVITARCSTTPRKDNKTCFLPEGCVAQYQDNPFTYRAGAIIDASVIEDNKAVNIRFQPLATYSLFSENILICGVPQEMFANKRNPMVLTYKTKASRIVQGIGCHELIRVDEMKTQEYKQ